LRQHGLTEQDLDDGETPALKPVSLYDLLKVYKHVLDTVPRDLVHQIIEEHATVEECIGYILAALERRSRVRFMDLIEGRDREAVVATFVGVLELLKGQRIHVQQAQPFADIWIEGRDSEVVVPVVRDEDSGERHLPSGEGDESAI
jgi:segregation and condensation protein A